MPRPLKVHYVAQPCTQESGIDVGQGIKVGPGKVGKKNAQNVQTYVDNLKISVAHGKNSKLNKHRAFNKSVCQLKKNPKLINGGHTFIPDYRIHIY